jgi:hypothetical protein
MATQTVRHEVHQAIETLPAEMLAELIHYIDYLKFKASHGESEELEVVRLGGLWKDVPFDLTDDDIRQARREFTYRLAQRAERMQ